MYRCDRIMIAMRIDIITKQTYAILFDLFTLVHQFMRGKLVLTTKSIIGMLNTNDYSD